MFKKLFGTVVTVFKLYMYFYQTFLNLFYHYFDLSIVKKRKRLSIISIIEVVQLIKMHSTID